MNYINPLINVYISLHTHKWLLFTVFYGNCANYPQNLKLLPEMGHMLMLCSLSKIAQGEDLAGLFGKTNTDAIDFFFVFSDKFGSVIISVGLALLLNKLFGLIKVI